LERDPQARVTVVTGFYHTRRARWGFRRFFGHTSDRIACVSAPVEDSDRMRWWKYESGFLQISGEYVKLFLYWLHYVSGS
jgi:uncharacterized SAM-binding protein YcdF (DUF218 family)